MKKIKLIIIVIILLLLVTLVILLLQNAKENIGENSSNVNNIKAENKEDDINKKKTTEIKSIESNDSNKKNIKIETPSKSAHKPIEKLVDKPNKIKTTEKPKDIVVECTEKTTTENDAYFCMAKSGKWQTNNIDILKIRDAKDFTIAHFLAKYNPNWTTNDIDISTLKNSTSETVAHFLAINNPTWQTNEDKILNLSTD